MTTLVSWSQVLAELEMLSHGSTVNWSPTGRSRSSEHGILADVDSETETYPHEYWRRRYDQASEIERPRIVRLALNDLESWRKRSTPIVVHEETEQELDKRIRLKVKDGWTVDEVAQSLRITPTRVRRAMVAAVQVEEDVTANQREKIRAYADQGISERQIARFTGVHRTTIRRLLGRIA